MIDRAEIQFLPDMVTEDRSQFSQPPATWVDLIWHDWRLEQGHTEDEKEWTLLYRGTCFPQEPDARGVCFETVRSIRKAKDFILETMEE